MYIKKMLISLHIFILGCLNVIKLAVWLFAIQTIVSLFSIVLITDSENPSEIIKALSIVMVLSSLMIMFFISKSSAYSDFEIYKNNLIRKRRKDEVSKINLMRQYKWFKGFVAGFVACLPTIVMAIIGIIKSPITSETNIFGKIVMIMNFVSTVPIMNYFGGNSLYYIFIGVFLMIVSAGLGYFFQGYKLKEQYFELQKRKK